MSTEFYRKQHPVARKAHKCTLCHEEIKTGEEYIRLVCKCTGYDIYDAKLHELCDDIQNRFLKNNPDDEYSDEWVLDDIADRVCSDCPEKDENCDYSYYSVPRCPRVIERYLQEAQP